MYDCCSSSINGNNILLILTIIPIIDMIYLNEFISNGYKVALQNLSLNKLLKVKCLWSGEKINSLRRCCQNGFCHIGTDYLH
jgi:hypothetical protein